MAPNENRVTLFNRGGTKVLVAAASRVGGRPLALLANSGPVSVACTLIGYFSAIAILKSNLPMVIRFTLVAGMMAGVVVVILRPFLKGRRMKALLERTPEGSPSHLEEGARVRLVGIARPRAGTFRTVLGRQALVARYIGSRGRRDRPRWLQRPHWELHAVDFDVVLSTGKSVRVLASELVLLPHPPRPLRQEVPVPVAPADSTDSNAWIYSEEVVSPGDEVEVAGIIRYVVDPAGYSASDHQARMVSLLTGDPSVPVVLRPRTSRAQPALRGFGRRFLATRE
jgi:hypothetical protein